MSHTEPRGRLLVVDDSPDTRELLHRNLSSRGYLVLTASDVAEARQVLETTRVDLVITDLKMPGASGLELVRYVKEDLEGTKVITITGYPSVESAVAAVKSGAEEYLSKPFTQDELFAVVGRAMERSGAKAPALAETDEGGAGPLGLVARSDAMKRVLLAIRHAAPGSEPVLVVGEGGSGKGLVARAIHYSGPRAGEPFIAVDPTGIPEELLARQLFGDPVEERPGEGAPAAGLLACAGGGTVFFRHVTDVPPRIRERLLQRSIPHGAPRSGGLGRGAVHGFRLIAAATIVFDVEKETGMPGHGSIRTLASNTIAIPPLRDRQDDVPRLARHFLAEIARRTGRPALRLSDAALEALGNHPWPGNVTELGNLLGGLARRSQGAVIDAADLAVELRSGVEAGRVNRSLAEVERDYIRAVLASVAGNKTRASEILGINRKTLRDKLRQHGEESTAN